jgi:hypothetical protein
VSVWSVVEPLTLEFNVEVPTEIGKPKSKAKSLKSKEKPELTRSEAEQEICHLISDQKMDIKQVSARLGVSLTTVRRVCRTRKIGTYSLEGKGTVSRSSQAPFGWDVIHGRLARNSKEWRWVLEIHGLRSSGTSLHKIADILSAKHVATKNGGRWHARTISQILEFNIPHLTKK